MERLQVTGLLQVNGHCLFSWREPLRADGTRTVEIRPEHCAACIAELRRYPRPFRLVYAERAASRR